MKFAINDITRQDKQQNQITTKTNNTYDQNSKSTSLKILNDNDKAASRKFFLKKSTLSRISLRKAVLLWLGNNTRQ